MLTGFSAAALVAMLAAGVVLDLLLGETRRWHPLVGFGRCASLLESWLNRSQWRLARGVCAWVIAVVPVFTLAWWLGARGGPLGHVVMLYLSLGLRSLREHTLPIHAALMAGDLSGARRLTARIVSRDTQDADPTALAKAGAESLLENGNDAVFGTLFWFLVAGGAGAVMFRLANTLDAMWGYRSERFNLFGRMAARVDDALNFVPARLTALSYVLLAPDGGRMRAWHCWRTQARAWGSPNAGPVMASGAGALGIALGGPASYGGQIEHRPPLGTGRAPAPADILRAWRMVLFSTLLWVALGCATALISYIGYPHA